MPKQLPRVSCVSRKAYVAALVLFMLFTGYLWLVSIFQTASLIHTETTAYLGDSPLLHISIIFLALFALAVAGDKLKRIDSKKCALYVTCFGFLFAVALIAITRVQPFADQKSVLDTARAINRGNTEAFTRGGYLSNYPHQLGLALLFQACNIIAGTGGDLFLIQGLNAAAIAVSVYCLYAITALLFQDKGMNILLLVLLVCFPQLLLYVTFAYGNLIGLALALLAIWSALVCLRKKSIRHGLLSALFIAFAVAVKQNSLIVLIAIAVYYLINAVCGYRDSTDIQPEQNRASELSLEKPLKQNRFHPRLCSLLMLAAVLSFTSLLQRGITSYYEEKFPRKPQRSEI